MRHLAIIILLGATMTDSAHSRPPSGPYSATAEAEILKRARDGETQAILELGRRASKESLEALQQTAIISEPLEQDLEKRKTGVKHQDDQTRTHLKWVYSRRSLAAKAGLARRGDSKSLNDLISNLESAEGDLLEVSIGYLGFTANPKAAPHIAPFLFKPGTPHKGDGWSRTYAEIAAEALGEIFPAVLDQLRRDNPSDHYLIEPWRIWWKEKQPDPKQDGKR